MAEKKLRWLKLENRFFDDIRIKKLRKIAGGDTYTCIYLKLMLYTLPTDGIIEYEGVEPTLEEEIALKIDEELTNIKVLLGFLSTNGLILRNEDDPDEFMLADVSKRIGCESAAAERMREMRERKKRTRLANRNNVTPQLQQVTASYTEKEKEKEQEKEKEKEKKAKLSEDDSIQPHNNPAPNAKKISELNEHVHKELFAYALLRDQAVQFEKFENYYFARNMEFSNWPRAYDSWLAKAVEFDRDNWRERTPRLEKMQLRNTATGEIEEQEVYHCRIAGYIVFPDGTYRLATIRAQDPAQEQETEYRRDVSKLLEGVRNASANH